MNARWALTLSALAIAVAVGAVYLRMNAEEPRRPGTIDEPQPLPDPTRADFRTAETSNGIRYWPRSAELEEGVLYRFNTGHCGLDYLTDFDGSFWEPHHKEGTKIPDFFFNEDEGTVRVLSHDRALYHSSEGVAALLSRHEGPLVEEGLCR